MNSIESTQTIFGLRMRQQLRTLEVNEGHIFHITESIGGRMGKGAFRILILFCFHKILAPSFFVGRGIIVINKIKVAVFLDNFIVAINFITA